MNFFFPPQQSLLLIFAAICLVLACLLIRIFNYKLSNILIVIFATSFAIGVVYAWHISTLCATWGGEPCKISTEKAIKIFLSNPLTFGFITIFFSFYGIIGAIIGFAFSKMFVKNRF